MQTGTQIQIDRSGQGHAWQDIDASDIPASAREEIEGEIIDGKQKTCSKFIASNGQHYRWSRANEKMKVQWRGIDPGRSESAGVNEQTPNL